MQHMQHEVAQLLGLLCNLVPVFSMKCHAIQAALLHSQFLLCPLRLDVISLQ